MNISFDLDSTLIPCGNEFETEKISKVALFFEIEKIRKRSKGLINELKNDGHKVHIYTTSFRSAFRIRCTLLYYGITVDKVINESTNQKVLRAKGIKASKYPPAFGFDFHIDDSQGVGLEADRFDFQAIIMNPSDPDWIEKVKNKIMKFEYK